MRACSGVRAVKSDIPLQNKEEQETLAGIGVGEKVRVLELQCEGAIRRRLLDLGLIPGTEVRAVMLSPLGNPMAYEIRDSMIALRLEDASKIIVKQKNIIENGKGAD
ncbi:ferrous iron transport protein A [Thermoproteota archaeon]